MKIAVMGHSGAGKSTLARELDRRYGCPVLHLDQVQFLPGWEERDREEACALVEDFLDRHDSWVIDGSYPSLCQQRRLREADQVLFLDYGRWTCLFRALGRLWRYRGRARPDMAEGCPERIDGAFLRWLLWEGRTVQRRQRHRQALAQCGGRAIVIKDQRQLDRYLEGTPC